MLIRVKQTVKSIIEKTTGYSIGKIVPLPVGADLFNNLKHIVHYRDLSILFDVGANTGQTKNWFRYNSPDAKIYCFEPVPSVFAELQRNCLNDDNVVVENIAFGNAPGEKKIRVHEECSVLNSLKEELMCKNPGAKEETVKIETIDNYCLKNRIDKIDLLKIDTEGFEIEALEGASEVLSSGIVSLIYCEVGFLKQNTRNTYFSELTELLANFNYYFFGLYQLDSHDWNKGGYLGNALYIKKSLYKG